ncbi:hypothetical protein CFIMG_005240RAa [Ceratocystis fimbriata CBS 114723]|uniref:Uncharacterized protein n=1 Tax=Ceratocystis fimbriata CBS 114723 TaxID=1035309 RepID=A0A2C5WZ28_9PEZI|nr:hypothetical protein CFIMG_005240RAa [Ceratocystis fimbriata CBS 114723]
MRSFIVLSLAAVATAITGTPSGHAAPSGTGSVSPTGSNGAVPPLYTEYPAAGTSNKASGAALAVMGAVAAYIL